MSQGLQAHLEIEGYAASIAAEIVRAAEEKTDDVAKEYLTDIVDSSAVIDRYIRARTSGKPESRSAAAQAAMKKAKAPSWGTPQASPKPSPVSTPHGSRPGTPKLASNPLTPIQSPRGTPPVPSSRPRNPDEPYTRGFLNPSAAKALANQNKEVKKPATFSKESRQYKIDAVADLDAAIKKLELADPARRACDCMGAVHGLLEMAPNCLNCGRVICNKEGLGNCLYCSEPLIPTTELKAIQQVLNQQRDAIVSSMGKNALKAAGITPANQSNLTKANETLERLLGYQASEAQRTKIIDEREDFETPDLGTNQWATPLEQARQLRNQQRQIRKQEELAKIRKGRGKKVLSISIRGDKVVEEVADHISESEEESEEEKVVPEDSDDAQKFWDVSRYGRNFIEPKYTNSVAIELPKEQKQLANAVSYNDDEVFSI